MDIKNTIINIKLWHHTVINWLRNLKNTVTLDWPYTGVRFCYIKPETLKLQTCIDFMYARPL